MNVLRFNYLPFKMHVRSVGSVLLMYLITPFIPCCDPDVTIRSSIGELVIDEDEELVCA